LSHFACWHVGYVRMHGVGAKDKESLIVESVFKVLIDKVITYKELQSKWDNTHVKLTYRGLIRRNWKLQFKHMLFKRNRSASNHILIQSLYSVMMLKTPLRELKSIIFNNIFETYMSKIVCIRFFPYIIYPHLLKNVRKTKDYTMGSLVLWMTKRSIHIFVI
jgi:hypothetical protein